MGFWAFAEIEKRKKSPSGTNSLRFMKIASGMKSRKRGAMKCP
jgi:hypothetical protein